MLFTGAVGLLAVILLVGLAVRDGDRGALADPGGGAPAATAGESAPTGRADAPEAGGDGTVRRNDGAVRRGDGAADRKKTAAARPTTRKQRMASIRIPDNRPKRYQIATTSAKPLGNRGQKITFNVRVQKGLPWDANKSARFMHTVLNDQRSWGRSGDWRVKLVGAGTRADVQAYIVTPQTTNDLCAPLRTLGRVSCQNGDKVVLNARRWAYGTKSYGNDLVGYRTNLVNHEFGHAFGHGHVDCPGKGKRAPIMMQQTKGLHGCTANPWPYPGKKKPGANR